MITTDLILLQAGNAGMMNLIFIGAMIVIFWLFMIRPQQKQNVCLVPLVPLNMVTNLRLTAPCLMSICLSVKLVAPLG